MSLQQTGRCQIAGSARSAGSIIKGGSRYRLALLLCCLALLGEVRGGPAAGWGQLRDGDLVFRAGRGLFSTLFSSIGKQPTPYSHVGIVYRLEDSLYVIHAEADDFTGIGFVRMEPLEKFLSPDNASAYAFKRVVPLTAQRRDKVMRVALAYVRRRVPFDTAFDLADDERLYCSELVYKAFLSAGVDLVDRPERILFPERAGRRSAEVITIGQLVYSSVVADIVQLVPVNHQHRRVKQ